MSNVPSDPGWYWFRIVYSNATRTEWRPGELKKYSDSDWCLVDGVVYHWVNKWKEGDGWHIELGPRLPEPVAKEVQK